MTGSALDIYLNRFFSALGSPRLCIIKSTFSLLFRFGTLSRADGEIYFLFEVKEKKRGTTAQWCFYERA